MRKNVIYVLLLVSIFLFESCSAIQKLNAKLFPYKDQSINKITSNATADAVVKKADTVQTGKKDILTIQAPASAPIKEVVVAKNEPIVNSTLITEPLREFRAAWIASVANINWPSKPGLTTEEQKTEAITLLNYLQTNNFNAVILQVRPQADALYKSDLEPWSYFLTGQQNKAPEPFYDPLEFWTEEAHKRGIELHAWLNPYRAHHTAGKSISDRSIVRTHPEMVYLLKEGFWWMDPALKSTQDHTVKVVMDIVKRYDIDGIHFDDYFYPYPSYNGDKDFPDDKSWNAYVKSGGKLSRGDWRRDAVNKLIQRLYDEIKKEKKYVKFGISPFGIWRPGYPNLVEGFDQYDKLYADAKLWLNKGWIDYFTPQLYWPTTRLGQSFPVLLGWWEEENTQKRHLWPGISIGTDKNGYANNQEVVSQIMISRGMTPKSMGIVHWHIFSLTKNPTLTRELREGPYKTPALIPASPWLGSKPPASPQVNMNKNGESITLNWNTSDKSVFKYVVYAQYDKKWDYQILTFNDQSYSLKLKATDKSGKSVTLKNIMVTAIDRNGIESQQIPMAVQ